MHLRIFAPGRYPQQGLGLQHPNTCTAKREILGSCGFNELIQHRIIEHGPPFRMVLSLHAENLRIDFGPLRGNRRFRGFKIRTQGGATRNKKRMVNTRKMPAILKTEVFKRTFIFESVSPFVAGRPKSVPTYDVQTRPLITLQLLILVIPVDHEDNFLFVEWQESKAVRM